MMLNNKKNKHQGETNMDNFYYEEELARAEWSYYKACAEEKGDRDWSESHWVTVYAPKGGLRNAPSWFKQMVDNGLLRKENSRQYILTWEPKNEMVTNDSQDGQWAGYKAFVQKLREEFGYDSIYHNTYLT